jgi:hypothetical protein
MLLFATFYSRAELMKIGHCRRPSTALSARDSMAANRMRKRAGIDPTVTARALWLQTHPLPKIPDQTRVPISKIGDITM